MSLPALVWMILSGALATLGPAASPVPDPDPFLTSDRCIACHKGVTTSQGSDVSIGYDWRASMMANSARDPYWQAAVRREVMDHPQAAAEIEAECSRCHMPMANEVSARRGEHPEVFAHLGTDADAEAARLARDGVSCAVCHRISPEALGEERSFTGGFVVEPPSTDPAVYGPFQPDEGGAGIMRSATGFRPSEGAHTRTSELCASCHTLLTRSVRADGSRGSVLPEQTPYLEWRNSAYAGTRSCQDCHMPEVGEDVPVTMVLGRARPQVSRHVFRGGNFFMLRMLARHRDELGVAALPQELELAANRTEEHLRTAAADVRIVELRHANDSLEARVRVTNRAGHKLPTAYPSRRAWLRVTVRDRDGRVVFESGALAADGRLPGDDHDVDATRFEPHHETVRAPDQVQIYQSVMVDGDGRVTTGLLSGERFVKDNRILPEGFDRTGADPRIEVRGAAADDPDFRAGSDEVRYLVAVDPGGAPHTVRAELVFQPIGYRWAENLAAYDAPETRWFVEAYRAMAGSSALVLAADTREGS